MHRDQVYRDPETGQFVAVDDDEPVELTYADHDFVNADLELIDTGAPGDEKFAVLHVEDDVLDLENDELGMLAWMTARLTAFSDFDEENGEEAGAVDAEAIIGSNLAGSEFLNQPGNDGGVQTVSETENAFADGVANDDPGVWAILHGALSPVFVSSADGAAGGGSVGRDRLTRHYYDETMGGPYIDSTDDITAGISVLRRRAEEAVAVEVKMQMAFVVFEYEHRRAEFAPYDPGPGQM